MNAQTIGEEPAANSSKKDKPFNDFFERVYFGGSLGAQFGTNTFINVSPLVGLKLNERFSVGAQFIYNYVDFKYSNYQYKDNILGYSLFGRAFIYEGLFATTSYQVINGRFDGTGQRVNVPSWFVGGGYLYRLSNYTGIAVSLLYNLTPSVYTPYANPMINVGMTFGW